jgi:hypothetical protein
MFVFSPTAYVSGDDPHKFRDAIKVPNNDTIKTPANGKPGRKRGASESKPEPAKPTGSSTAPVSGRQKRSRISESSNGANV